MKRGAKTPKGVDGYFAALEPAQRAVLEKLRKTIQAAAPDATEAISYQMPAFKLRGRVLVYYAAFRDHYSLFPASGAVIDQIGELQPYVAGKGTLRFTADEPIPARLVRKIVKLRQAELDSALRR